ncbi:hypothetical protein GCM10010145_32150 [Streptomyces ruber]|uniref:Uncharacterized protein n=2 Tax=Streptomyces TaxID=1883 RepID=A0A918BCY4_9ACTN|nr:hypothetical protein [Streptomyces ruber]GGQ59693.1 hypothetical protein GCM10010145_32150 [Streptomyces ruber]
MTKFLLEVDLEQADWDEDTAVRELGRILRYWGGNLHHYALRPGDGSALYDSAYREVGSWAVAGGTAGTPGAAERPGK